MAVAWAGAACAAEFVAAGDNPPLPRRAQDEAPAADPPRLDTTLRNVLWQTLPEEVKTVYAGPDGRVWHMIDRSAESSEIRRSIEREFRQDAPQIIRQIPVLFEPGGRVWFGYDNRRLLGYDGREWIERRTEKAGSDSRHFTGWLPGLRSGEHHSVNVFADGHAFFADSAGVHVFDGRAWTYEFFSDQSPHIDLLVLGDGKTVVAYGCTSAVVRVWRGGTWTDMPVAAGLGGASIRALAPWGERAVWGFFGEPGDQHMRLWTLADAPAETVAALVVRLGGNEYADREVATRSLIDLGPPVLAAVEKARAAARDPEVQVRLRRVIEAMKATEGAVSRLGAYELASPLYMGGDSAGRFYVGSPEIRRDGHPLGAGVAVVAPSSKEIRVFPWDRASRGWWGEFGRQGFKGAVDGGRKVWVSGSQATGPARLFDLDRDVFVAEASDRRFYEVLATLADGTAFLKVSWHGFDSVVGVCRPGMPDDRTWLDTTAFRLTGENACVMSADGTLWADLADQGLARLEKGRWQPVSAPGGRVDWITLGRGGTLLARMLEQVAPDSATNRVSYVFCSTTGVRQDWDLRRLLAACRAEAAAAFSGDCLSAGLTWGRWPGSKVAADRGGNLWLLDKQKLWVLAGDRWIEADDLVKAHQTPGPSAEGRTIGEIAGMAAPGDGRRVYLSGIEGSDAAGQSLFGEVRGGRIVLEPAPGWAFMGYEPPVRDEAGAFWIRAPLRGKWPEMPPLVPLTSDGPGDEIRNTGFVVLRDWGGNVWLGDRQIKGRLHIWRQGQFETPIHVPSFSPSNRESALASDRPGSAWAWTTSGLYHLTADDPAAPARFAIKARYDVRGVFGHVRNFLCPPGGPLVIVARQSGAESGWVAYLVPLPQ